MTLEDVANQLLLPILGDTDPAALELSPEEEAIEVELRKRKAGNAKLSYWVSSSSKFSTAARREAFITFWLCKFVFWVPPPLCHKTFVLSFGNRNIYEGEPAAGSYVPGALVCSTRYPP